MDCGCGLSIREPTLHVGSPEFKPQFHQKTRKERERERERERKREKR
jgi:hypothetical protein